MITLRQMERLWHAKQYEALLRLALRMRPEDSERAVAEMRAPVAASAMAVIRLEELNQSHAPFCAMMIRTILGAQGADGGWGEPAVTALCIRALMCSQGDGLAIDRGIAHLASLQKSEGIWPRVAIRRMPADAFVSAFILYELGDDERFRRAVRVDDAVAWFEQHRSSLDAQTLRLWRRVSLRQRVLVGPAVWS